MPDEERNKEVVRAVEEAWETGNLDVLDQYFAEGYAPGSAVPGLPPGLAGAKMAHGGAMQTFPDRHVEIEDMVAEGDKVAIRCRVTGTNDGGFQLFGVGPNGNKVDFEWISIYTLKDGKIVDHVGLNDALKLGQQLGAIPMPG